MIFGTRVPEYAATKRPVLHLLSHVVYLFSTQYDVNFPNLFLRIFNHLENQYVVPYLGTRETKEKHDVCQNVCHNFDFAYNALLWPYKSRIYASR